MSSREQAEYYKKKAELEEKEAKLKEDLKKLEEKKDKLDVNPLNAFGRQSNRIFDFINFAQAKAQAFTWIMLMIFWLHMLFVSIAIVNMFLGSDEMWVWIALILIPLSDYYIYKNYLKIEIFKKVDESGSKRKSKKN